MVEDHQARAMAQRALDRIDSHEDICAERYAGIIDGIKELRAEMSTNYRAIIGVGVAIILALIAFIFREMVH